MKISVIIPARNEEAVMSQVLKAVLAQDHPDYEIIVVDNGSTDRTFEIASTFKGVKPIKEERMGTMWACERGRVEANGDIIVRLDADCEPVSDWLSRGLLHFSDPDVVIVSGPNDYHDHTKFFRSVAMSTQRYIFYWIHSLAQALKLGGITNGGNTFIRASALEKAGGFNTNIIFYGDDTDITKRLIPYGMCVFDRSLIMKTSGRRFKKEGVIKLQARYTYHFLRSILSK